MWIPLFRLAGVRLYLDPLVAVVIAYLVLSADALYVPAAIMLASVLLHELAHAWAAKRRGLAVSGIFLHLVPFAYVERGKPEDEVRVALAAPLLNLAIAAVLCVLPAVHGSFPWLDPARWFEDPLWTAFAINLLMGTFNLVPALPADGGRALRAGLLLRKPAGTAYRMLSRTGTGVGVACIFFGVLRWPSTEALLFAVLGAFFVVKGLEQARVGAAERARDRARARAQRDGEPT